MVSIFEAEMSSSYPTQLSKEDWHYAEKAVGIEQVRAVVDSLKQSKESRKQLEKSVSKSKTTKKKPEKPNTASIKALVACTCLHSPLSVAISGNSLIWTFC